MEHSSKGLSLNKYDIYLCPVLKMDKKTNKYLVTAVLLGLLFHGVSIFFTLENTYDALIHLFFADHYLENWFETWNQSWYTGFTVVGYPPLVHQVIALFSLVGGLKFGLFTVALLAVLLFITGVYRFSLLVIGSRTAAGYAAILAVFSSSFIETLHLFGQLPSIIGIALLMHALPEIYNWLLMGKKVYLLRSVSIIAVTVCSHHVTPIFGMVFFVFPIIGMALMDLGKEHTGAIKNVTLKVFTFTLYKNLRRILLFGSLSLVCIIVCILPYWINTKNNPITQVPIPHGSRDNFLEVTSSGLVFFIIPWGILLLFLPYIISRYFKKRYLFFGISFIMLFVLGTGGTTPIPRAILGDNAFNILTLDRFTLWASIMALPMFGEFVFRFSERDIKTYFQEKWGQLYHRIVGAALVLAFIFMAVFSMSLGYFRPSQPKKIDMVPIVNFLNQDGHDQWRYLPLGFGDQMAWLSAQTDAMTVDGNYHSARRLPELTTRAVERLENSKFNGVEGIGSLQQFLTMPNKYHLKYVFSNDKFYDPILYFAGWQELQRLENGIAVWEKPGVHPIPSKLWKEELPLYQGLLWGIMPVLMLFIVLLVSLRQMWKRTFKTELPFASSYIQFQPTYNHIKPRLMLTLVSWVLIVSGSFLYLGFQLYNTYAAQISPTNAVQSYYDAVDFKNYEKAYSFLAPDSKNSLGQYMLEISVSDGLLSSYAKLDAIEFEEVFSSDTLVRLSTTTHWITPIKRFEKVTVHTVKKMNDKWYLEPTRVDTDIPTDQLFSSNNVSFYNHGRRKITTGETYHEDVLKQPEIKVLSSRLVIQDGQYAVIGEVQNIDNVPASISIESNLYNSSEGQIASYRAKDVLHHTLMPQETSPFRINFEGIAWRDLNQNRPSTFNPDEFTSIELNSPPESFTVSVDAHVSTKGVFRDVSLQEMSVSDGSLSGTIYNFGMETITIPQLLISYFNSDKELLWTNVIYLEESVRPQRRNFFKVPIIPPNNGSVISKNASQIMINGLEGNELIDLEYKEKWENSTFLETGNEEVQFISVKVNPFIGNSN